MKCLLLLPRPVFPLVCGYALKNYNLIKILAAKYELYLIIITSGPLMKEEMDFYQALGIHVRAHEISKWKSYIRTLLGFFSGKPLQVSYYYDRDLQDILRPFLEECQILIAALVRTREYLNPVEELENKVIVFDMVDSIALNYRHSREKTKSFFWKLIYGIEGKRLMKYERRAIENSHITYLFNGEEQSYWSQYGNVKLLPHGVKEELFHYSYFDERWKNAVVFIGKMDYQPNVDAALWYMENVHSRIGNQVPLVIVGAYPADKILERAASLPNVTVTGFVDDPYVYLNSAMAVIAPMQTGGGIQNKVLEGMALGKVNIISSLAAGPIKGGEAGRHFLVADSAEEYVDILLNWGKNQEKYKIIGGNARELIKERYSWKRYGEMYLEGIEEVRRYG